MTSVDYVDGTAVCTIYNSERGSTIQVEIAGLLGEGIHVYFDAPTDDFVEESVYSKWDEEFQKKCFFGDDWNSVWENLNPVEEEDKLSFIEGFDDLVNDENISYIIDTFSNGHEAETVKSITKEALGELFRWYNEPSDTSQQEVWSEVYQMIEPLEQGVQEDVLMTITMLLAVEGDQAFFQDLCGTQVASIENIFVADGELSTNEKVACMMLEMNGGLETGGLYGGVNFLSTDSSTVQVLEADGVVTNGQVFGVRTDGVTTIVDENWSDIGDTKAAMQLYQEAITQTKWITQDAAVTEFIDTLTEMEEYDGLGIITDEMIDEIAKAIDIVDADDANSGTDGIKPGEYYSETVAALNLCLQPGVPIETVASSVLNYIQTTIETKHDGDVLSGFIYYLNKKCPSLMKAILKVPGFKSTAKGIIDVEKGGKNAARKTEAMEIMG